MSSAYPPRDLLDPSLVIDENNLSLSSHLHVADSSVSTDTTTATTTAPPPPLAADTRDLVLSHLVPPAPPLAPHLLSRSFIERLQFLPPTESELDAHISPYPQPASDNEHISNPLTHALEELSSGFNLLPTAYAHDGESFIARCRMSPSFFLNHDDVADGAVDAFFEYEVSPPGGAGEERGWVYAGATMPKAFSKLGPGNGYGNAYGGDLSWVHRVEDVASSYSTDSTTDDYWAGFTPPSADYGGGVGVDDADEDDYWAQYGAGVEQEPSPAVRTPIAKVAPPDPAATLTFLLKNLAKERGEHNPEDDDGDEPQYSPHHFDPAVKQALPEIPIPSPPREPKLESPIKVTTAPPTIETPIPTQATQAPATQSTITSPIQSPLEQKLRAKIRSQLQQAWKSFSANQDAEHAGFEWLRIGREIANRPAWSTSEEVVDFDARTAVLKARVAAAAEVAALLGSGSGDEEERESEKEWFWRAVEECIRVRNVVVGGEEQGYEDS